MFTSFLRSLTRQLFVKNTPILIGRWTIDYDKNIHDYLGDIDSQIKEAKSKAQKLQKTRYIICLLIILDKNITLY